ncbi:hypothetical protein [Spirillospora sp. NBC_01491]|uniref:hypothetical protein n=1 Tax=Spirillospora sp. NBC_01491 TaxID=2976007 RepID=UPI002E2F93AF|nr:hypothetical protein [Spirillospora sp. NBC_01491]
MDPEIYVAPDGSTMTEVTTPTVAVRLRARGWLPLDEAGYDDAPGDLCKLSPESTTNR